MLKIKNADDLPAHLSARGAEYFEVSARRKGRVAPPGTVAFAVETTSFIRVRDRDGIDVRVRITGAADFFEAATDVAVLLDFCEELVVSDQVRQAFLAGRGFEIAYPYAKEAFEQAIARIGFPGVLPVAPTLAGGPELAVSS